MHTCIPVTHPPCPPPHTHTHTCVDTHAHTLTQFAGGEETSCRACGLLYGESTMGDGAWIRCLTCAAAYHGACIGLTQRAVTGMAGKWDCRRCAAAKAVQRQAAIDKYKARRAARGASAPFKLTEQVGLGAAVTSWRTL